MTRRITPDPTPEPIAPAPEGTPVLRTSLDLNGVCWTPEHPALRRSLLAQGATDCEHNLLAVGIATGTALDTTTDPDTADTAGQPEEH